MKRTNIVLDESKLKAVKKITHLETNRAVVDFALERIVRTSQALKGLEKLKGKVHFYRSYNYKTER